MHKVGGRSEAKKIRSGASFCPAWLRLGSVRFGLIGSAVPGSAQLDFLGSIWAGAIRPIPVGLARALAWLGAVWLGLAPSGKSLLFCLAGILVFL